VLFRSLEEFRLELPAVCGSFFKYTNNNGKFRTGLATIAEDGTVYTYLSLETANRPIFSYPRKMLPIECNFYPVAKSDGTISIRISTSGGDIASFLIPFSP
jgi:hypothetical protein